MTRAGSRHQRAKQLLGAPWPPLSLKHKLESTGAHVLSFSRFKREICIEDLKLDYFVGNLHCDYVYKSALFFVCVAALFFFFFFFAKLKNELWKWYIAYVSAPPAPPQSKIVDMPLTEGSQRALYGSSLPLWASPGWCSSCTPSKMGCRPWRRGQAASQWHSPTMGTHTRCCTLEECIWWEKRQRYPGQTSRYILVLLVRNESLAITVED